MMQTINYNLKENKIELINFLLKYYYYIINIFNLYF